jgi:hypothetical protein
MELIEKGMSQENFTVVLQTMVYMLRYMSKPTTKLIIWLFQMLSNTQEEKFFP